MMAMLPGGPRTWRRPYFRAKPARAIRPEGSRLLEMATAWPNAGS
jgi:hypothetical protein